MKEKEAVYGNSIMRAGLRSEARKYIGDTGLLDHLLKHMAGKVAPGGVERFRRRHNVEGSMEYWLESADLVDIRQEIGVQDPYWTPPPGWKPVDSILPDHVARNELRKIKEDINQLMRYGQFIKFLLLNDIISYSIDFELLVTFLDLQTEICRSLHQRKERKHRSLWLLLVLVCQV
jgi:hypothetical protein